MGINILPRSQFLNSLRIEKRRVDRSKAPLSLALFYFPMDTQHNGDGIRNVLMSLQRNTRETDIKGWVDHNVIGLILPDTDEKGLDRCIEKIGNGEIPKTYSVITGTYPNDLFEKLISAEEVSPDFFPIDLDEAQRLNGFTITLKRIIDVAGSITGIVLLSPLMVVTALAIRLTSPGPALFGQIRHGRKGARFKFYKFRSMYWDSDDLIHREYVTQLINGKNEEIDQGTDDQPFYKMKSDMRVTPVGKLIRKTSIDELPQLFNVLRGDMSLVGPRPPLPYEVEKYQPWHLRRILEVKPGMTGLWQVDGRSKTAFDDMVRLDLRYAQNWSLWLDAKILLKTVKAVLRPNGAV